MKTAEEIKKEITETNARIAEREQENEARAEKRITEWEKLRALKKDEKNATKADALLTPAEQENNERLERAMANAEQENKRDRIRAAILQENLTAANLEMVSACAFELLQKYAGKPYGEKTRAKIADEAREACGFRVYFSDKYGAGMITAYGDGFRSDEITISAPQFVRILTDENKITEPNEEEKSRFCVAYQRARYTEPEQIDARIDEIIAAHDAAAAAIAAYNAAADKYNELCPNNIERAERIYKSVKEI